MMLRKCGLVLALALALALALGATVEVFAREGVSECSAPPVVTISGLDRSTCQVLGSVIVERYLVANPSSPYASAFDQRDLTIVQGKDSAAVMATVGIENRVKDFSIKPELLHFPMADQVFKTGIARKKFNHRSWSVSTQIIEYGAQGGSTGFQLTCAVAMHSSAERTLVVTECFPLEDISIFINAIDLILH